MRFHWVMREDMQRICGTDNLYIDLCKMQNKKKICRPLSVAEHFLCLVSCDEYLGIFRSVFSQFFSRVFVLLGIFSSLVLETGVFYEVWEECWVELYFSAV